VKGERFTWILRKLVLPLAGGQVRCLFLHAAVGVYVVETGGRQRDDRVDGVVLVVSGGFH
jgi:hypothetical protein